MPRLPAWAPTRGPAQTSRAFAPRRVGRGWATGIVGALEQGRLEFGIAALELKVTVVEMTDLFLESADLRFQPIDFLPQASMVDC